MKRKDSNLTVMAGAALVALLVSGCGGGGGTGLTTPFLPGTGSQSGSNDSSAGSTDVAPDAVFNSGGNGDTTLNIPGGTGSNGGNWGAPEAHVPAVTEPTAEQFTQNSSPGEDDVEAWLKDCFETLPDPRTNPAGVFQNESLQNWAYEIFAASNRARKENGLAPLQYEVHLEALAQAHARDMALRNYFAHDTPDGVLSWDRWVALNPPYVLFASENAAKGQNTAQRVVDQWLASPGHRKNLLNPDIEWTGIGVYFDPTDRDMPIHVIAEYGAFRDDPTSHDWYERGDVWNR